MFDFTPPHLHLLVNHFPVEGSIIVLALLIYAMIRKNAELKRIALVGFVLLGIAAYVSDLTGGGASHEMRNVSGIDKQLIHEHSEAADWARNISYVFAVVALVGLIQAWRNPDNKEPKQWVIIACLIGGLFEVSTFAKTAYQGGLIRHPEIQSSFPVPGAPPVDTTKK
jgi:RsiW-degrading membrane proteinase PrsW (M82 family)